MKKLEYQTNFTSGELSPRLWGHVDLAKYKNGVEVGTNCRIFPHGPILRRSGTQYIATTKTITKKAVLIRFQFSQSVALMLEFGHNYIRFFKDKAAVGAPYDVVTTYTETEVFELNIVQFGNTLYISHYNHRPATLVRTSDSSWALQDIFFYPPATLESGYAPALTLTPAATTGLGVNFTASGAVFLAGDVGRQLQNLGGRGKASIVSITSTTVVVADIIEDFPSTSAIASGSWKLDLSPVSKLTVDGTSAGMATNFTSFYTDSARGPGKAITGITNANPGVVTCTAHGYANGDKVEIKGVLGMTQVNNRIWTAKGVTANTFNLANDDNANFDTTAYTAYTSGGTAKKKLADIGLDCFRAADVGRFVLINNGVGEITAVNSAQSITVDIQKALNSSTASSNWSLETDAWSSTNGYPRCVALYQSRIWYASTINNPQSIWASETGVFDSLGAGSEASDGLDLELSTREISQVNWMMGLRNDLVTGTAGAELSVGTGSASTGPITPDNVSQDARSYHGSILQQAVGINNEILYIPKPTNRIHSLYYDFSVDSYKSDDLLFLAEHLSESGIVQLAYAQYPDSTVYAVTTDGTLLVGAYVRDQQVIAWTKYITDGIYESVQTLSTGTSDQIWVVVKRTINGSTTRYVEVFENNSGTGRTDGFSDSFLVYSEPLTITSISLAAEGVVTSTSHGISNGDDIKFIDMVGMTELEGIRYLASDVTANTFKIKTVAGVYVNTTTYTAFVSGNVHELVTTISGLDHLEGETVEVKVDGATHPARTVTAGAITLQSPGYEVTVGLPYTTTITTLKKEFTLGAGSQQGQQTRFVRPILRLYNSKLPLLNGEYLPARDPTDIMDKAVDLFTGDTIYGPLGWSNTGQLTITATGPYPMILLGIFGSLDSGSQKLWHSQC